MNVHREWKMIPASMMVTLVVSAFAMALGVNSAFPSVASFSCCHRSSLETTNSMTKEINRPAMTMAAVVASYSSPVRHEFPNIKLAWVNSY
jgi:fructose-specific phosphotransferase system IIC component